ncbi:MAG: DUF3108 domain-containing protein [Pseudomonadota bacterium]
MIWLVVGLWIPRPLFAETVPETRFPVPPHRSVHEVLRNGSKVGEVHSELSVDERGIWFFDTRTVATSTLARMLRLSAEESANFLWQDDTILPLTYRQIARSPMRTRYWQHQLDWDQDLSHAQTWEGDLDIELEAGLLDPLTLRLQTSALLNRQAIADDTLTFRVLERDRIEDQRMERLGDQQIQSSIGCFDTELWYRFRREGSSRNYRMWVAESLHWMPIRIDLSDDDDDDAISLRLIESSLVPAQDDCD